MSIFKKFFGLGGRHRSAKAAGGTGVTNVNSNTNLIKNQQETVDQGLRDLYASTPSASNASVQWAPQHFTPQLQGQSAMGGVQANTTAQSAQLAALRQLQGASHYGGAMGAQEVAGMNRATTQAGLANAQNQAAVQQAAIGRGIRGGGAEAAAGAAGTGVGAVYSAGTNNMVNARQRALQALGGSADVGGQLRQQGMGEQFDRADAQNAINVSNLGRTTQAGELNAGVDTQASMYNSQNPFRQASHDLTRAGLEAGNTDFVRDLTTSNNEAQRQTYRDLFSGAVQGAGSAAQYASTQNADEDESDRKKSRY